jgi:hypothetical protein
MRRLVPLVSLLLVLVLPAIGRSQTPSRTAIPTQPTPVCKANYDAEVAQVVELLEEFAADGWSQDLQDRLAALVGDGFAFFLGGGGESMTLQPVIFSGDSDFYALQSEIDFQQSLNQDELDAYLANAISTFLCQTFTTQGLTVRYPDPVPWIGLVNYARAMAARAQQQGAPTPPPPPPPPPAWPYTPPPLDPPPWTDPFDRNCLWLPIHEFSRSTSLDVFICQDPETGSFGAGIGITFRF